MDQDRKNSTRLWILVVAIFFAITKEVLDQFGIKVSTETLLTVEGALLAIAGLDTFRPLGARKVEFMVVEEDDVG